MHCVEDPHRKLRFRDGACRQEAYKMEDVSLQEQGRARTWGESFVFLWWGKNVNDLLLD